MEHTKKNFETLLEEYQANSNNNNSFLKELIDILQKDTKIKENNQFWLSNIPVNFCKEIFDDKTKISANYLLYCFSKENENNINQDFVIELSKIYPQKFIRFAKLSQSFLSDKHFKSFEFLKDVDNENLNIFYKEVYFLFSEHKYLKSEIDKYERNLNNIEWDIFLILISKNSYWSLGLIQNMGEIVFELFKRKKGAKDQNVIMESKNNKHFDKKLQQIENSNTYFWFDELVESIKNWFIFKESIIGGYIFDENAEMDFSDPNEYKLKQIDSKISTNWFRNAEKYYPLWNNFYANKFVGKLTYPPKIEDNQIKCFMYRQSHADFEQLKDLGIQDRNALNFFFILNFLKIKIGDFKIDKPSPTAKQSLKVYQEHELKDLIKSIVSIFDITNIDIQKVLDTMAVDLKKDAHIDIMEKPFIKYEDIYFIITHQFANCNFATSIGNILLKNKYSQNLTKDINAYVTGEFIKNGFETPKEIKEENSNLVIDTKITDIDYKEGNENNIKGDFDIIVYKDGYIFILEMKYTHIRFRMEHLYYHKKQQLDKASLQLTKAKEYILSNFIKIKELLSLNENDASSLKGIKTLIVSTSFEYDDYDFGEHQKISLFELLGILRNESHLLLNNVLSWNSKKKIITFETNERISGGIFLREINQRTFWGDLYKKDFSQHLKKIEYNLIGSKVNNAAIFIMNKEYEKAEKLLLQVLEFTPNNHTALGNIGLCYTFLNKLNDAEFFLLKAIQIIPNFADYYDKLGEVFVRKKEYDKALSLYNKAIELDKKFARAYYNRGCIYRLFKNEEKQFEDWKNAEILGWIF